MRADVRAALTCLWRSSQASQEVPVQQEGQPPAPPPWGTQGARAEGALIRVRNVGRGYAQCDVDQALQEGRSVGVLRSDGSWVHTGPIVFFFFVWSKSEIYTERGRYLLEVLPAETSGAKTPRRGK